MTDAELDMLHQKHRTAIDRAIRAVPSSSKSRRCTRARRRA